MNTTIFEWYGRSLQMQVKYECLVIAFQDIPELPNNVHGYIF